MSLIKKCAYNLKLGKARDWFGRSTYKVCITPTQHAKLFGPCEGNVCRPPAPIGCGVFACAFPHRDPDKVVKITRDGSDVAGLQNANGLPRAPQLFEHYNLGTGIWTRHHPDQEHSPRVSAVVVERLYPIPAGIKRKWSRRLNRMALAIEKGASINWIVDSSCPRSSTKERERCARLARGLARAREAFAARGVALADLHIGNLGIDRYGRWKILDLGFSGLQPADAPYLEGARRSARRRRRAR